MQTMLMVEPAISIQTKGSMPFFRTQKLFFDAVAAGDMDVVRDYLQKDANTWANLQDKKTKESALHIAARHGQLAVFSALLPQTVNGKTLLDANRQTPLHRAAEAGHIDIVRAVMTDNSYINTADRAPGLTPLQHAIGGGHIEIVKLLLTTGKIDLNNPPALHYAVAANKPEAVNFLLAAGADPNVPKVNTYNDYDDDYGYSYGRHSRPRETRESPLQRAAIQNETDIALALMDAGGKAGEAGETPLHYAARNGNIALATALLERGADVNQRNSDNATPLLWAAEHKQLEMLTFLLANRANPQLVDKNSRTPLSVAQQFAMKDIIDILQGPRPEAAPLKPVVAVKPAPPVPPPPPAAAPPQPAPAVHPMAAVVEPGDGDSWKLSGKNKLLHVCTYGDLGRRLTEIFNFESRERLVIGENLKLNTETMAPPESFDTISEAALTKALAEFRRAGGTAEDDTVFQNRFTKLKLKPA